MRARPPEHWPALDGVRALAVVAVVVYHARPDWLRGGFLGVDVFFVLSGFLITSLLLRRHRTRGTQLRDFWLRRARRLLPALYLLLLGVLGYALLRHLGLDQLRLDVGAAFGYATNWFLIGHQQSYFTAFSTPDALQHLWSLAVEEQFYLVWPLVVALGLLRRRGALAGVLLAALGSTLLCAFLFSPGTDPSRVYYGTDTHSAGLLVGAALALVHAQRFPRPTRTRTPRKRALRLATALGLAATAALVGAFLLLDETQPLVYRGGFTVVALAAALLVGVLLHPAGRRVARVFAWAPARWLGVRSYGVYLWHWPILVLASPHGDPGESPPALVAAQVAAAVLLAAISYRFVETPVRSGAALRGVRALLARARGNLSLRLAWGGGVGALAGAVGALGLAMATAQPPPAPDYQRVAAVHLTTGMVAVDLADAAGRDGPSPTPARARAATAATHNAAATPAATGLVAPPRVTAVGDSVMLGAAPAMARAIPNLDLDAKVGRQMSAALDILRADRDAHRLGDVVVVHMGSNGFLTRPQIDEMMQVLSGVRWVVLLNDKVPRPWQDPNDALLSQAAHDYPQIRLVDWRGASTPHPGLFWDDATHLRPEGAAFYASLVAAQVPKPTPPAPPPPPQPAPSATDRPVSSTEERGALRV